MTSFALTGNSGAGKSYFSFELAKVFIDNGFKAKYFALEEGLGKLTQNKVRFYGLDNNITITGKGSLRDVRRDAKLYDLIVIDSFQKLNVKAEEFERLRQDFPKTIFIIIFQKTASGSMRGGSSIKFNSSATIDVQIRDEEHIAFMEKGRYGTIGWVYSIDEGRLILER
jgi:DNA replication protein DnaC